MSAVDVLHGQAPAQTFQDKLVFVGTTALWTLDLIATPFDAQFAGVEVQATVADNLLQRDFIRRLEHGVALETLVVLALGLGVVLLVGRIGLAWGALGAAACLVALWGAAIWLVSTSGVFVSPLFPTIGVISALAAMTPAKLLVERRRADRAGEATATSQRIMVQSLLSLTEVRDAETGRHSRRTQQYVRLLAERLSTHAKFHDALTPERIELLSSLAPLHDIGKVGIPDGVLNKPGALTTEELAEMRKHPAYGRDVILHAEQRAGVTDDVILAVVKEIAYTHHERWDGTGYPEGLRGADIPLAGRLVALVDAYDTIVSGRLYRESASHEEAVAFITAGKGTQFDPDVVDAFLEVADEMGRLSRNPII